MIIYLCKHKTTHFNMNRLNFIIINIYFILDAMGYNLHIGALML